MRAKSLLLKRLWYAMNYMLVACPCIFGLFICWWFTIMAALAFMYSFGVLLGVCAVMATVGVHGLYKTTPKPWEKYPRT